MAEPSVAEGLHRSGIWAFPSPVPWVFAKDLWLRSSPQRPICPPRNTGPVWVAMSLVVQQSHIGPEKRASPLAVSEWTEPCHHLGLLQSSLGASSPFAKSL